jgi:ATP-dependent DNA helicase RecG
MIGNSFIENNGVNCRKTSEKTSEKSSEKTTQKTTQEILNLIEDNRFITTSEMAYLLNRSRSAIAKQIAKLKENNELKRIGPDKGGHWEIV